ncbi:TetR/AcrR family transcriptional regulator [Psychromonas ossibalaenae]|uniref:TetR/AcrR family transcriptional regulator n=1 Tax=Psychromonas ossibalaenae TaxID=444922 RepID=UPI0003719811|nr:TetR/AcrR family transcriptional regulator [Psychromonas ossibalaenae]
MGKIEQNKEKKRRVIIEAAQNIFLSEGYTLASMDKIAALAKVTKQTVYRYFPSKVDLFQATLNQMGEMQGGSFRSHLQKTDTNDALNEFAKGFIQAHLSSQHLATIRLLIAEGGKAPEITRSFCAVGPDQTAAQLSAFFTERLGIKDTESTVRLWISMLLAYRTGTLIGLESPTEQQIEEHARKATDFLLAAAAQ